MSASLRVLFRADAGTVAGHGHMTRVETLARAVTRRQGEALVVSRPLAGGRPVASDLPPTAWLPVLDAVGADAASRAEDAALTMAAANERAFKPLAVVVDHYELGPVWEQAVRATGAFVVALDDTANRPHVADLVVELVPLTVNVERLCGLKFLPIDGAYALTDLGLPSIGWELLVVFGGSDPTGHTIIALDALDALDTYSPGLIGHSHIVLGAGHPASAELLRAVTEHTRRTLYRQPLSLAPIMARCHVVLTAAGNAMTEAIAAGRPTIAVVTADNQVQFGNYLANAGVVRLLPLRHHADHRALRDALHTLPTIWANGMSAAVSNSLIDTLGADRLIDAILDRIGTTFT